jgi:taurine dioxygenase
VTTAFVPNAASAAGHANQAQSIEIRAFDGPAGAEVLGLDLSKPLGQDDFARIHRAHLDHHVLVFRDQRITPDQQIAFSRRFGPLQIHVLHQFQLPGYPEVLIVSNIVENGQPIGLGDAGHYWHSDLSYKEKPSLGSLLHAQELPSEGGDTLFANMHLAWDTLPAHLRSAVQGRSAEHTYLAKYAELQKRSPWRPNLSAEQIAQVKPVALRQRAFHDPRDRLAGRREQVIARGNFRAQRAPRASVPASMGRTRHGVLGQPLIDASGGRHARSSAPQTVSHDD